MAVRIEKRNGKFGVSDSTVARFERGEHWPEDPDATLAAYAEVAGITRSELWHRACEHLAQN